MIWKYLIVGLFLLANIIHDNLTPNQVDAINSRRETLTVTPWMDSLWKETERCSERTGDISEVHFYVVHDSTPTFIINHKVVAAYWMGRDNSITFHQAWSGTALVVKHEMLHALRHDGEHDNADFLIKCDVAPP